MVPPRKEKPATPGTNLSWANYDLKCVAPDSQAYRGNRL